MSALLTDNLPMIAASSGGVKKLRELILELAIRGKLVPQDPKDEPANELLKRIRAEKAQLVKSGRIKAVKLVQEINEVDKPYVAPPTWEWVRIRELGHDWGQKIPKNRFTYIDVSAVDNTKGFIQKPVVLNPEEAPSRARKLVQRDTVIYSTVRPYLQNIAVIDRDIFPEPIASTAFAIVHPLKGISSKYLFWYLRSPTFNSYVESVQIGVAYPAINDTQFFSGLICLPPFAEQHRIVAKIDELMAVCDRLQSQQVDADSAHNLLINALLGTLCQSQNQSAFAINWERVRQNFDSLFNTEASVDALNQTVLQLAVQGKLVQQGPNDEPAGELLKRIQTEKAKRRIEKLSTDHTISKDTEPFDPPKGWIWIRLGSIIHLVSGQHLAPTEYFYTQDLQAIPYLTGPAEFGDKNPAPTRFTHERRAVALLGDILVTVKGSGVGKTNLVNQPELAISRQLMAVRPILINMDFLYAVLKTLSRDFQAQVVGIAIPGISREDVQDALICLPPLEEQRRIVAKLVELTALCNRLKSELEQTYSLQELVVTTLIEQAVDSPESKAVREESNDLLTVS